MWCRYTAAIKKYFPFLALQSLAQGINLLSGIIVVRLLDYEGYALYAFAGTLIGAASTSGDLGTGSAILTFLPKQSSVESRLEFFCAADSLRKRFLLATLVGVTIIFAATFFESARQLDVIFTILVVNVVIVFQNRAEMLGRYLAADCQLGPINRSATMAAVLRFGIFTALLALGWVVSAPIPVIAWALAAWLQYYWLRLHCQRFMVSGYSEARQMIIEFIKPLIPGHAYYICQSIFPMFSLGWLGTTQDMAELGALGRFGSLTAFLTPVLVNIAHPYLSRSTDEAFASRATGVLASTALIGIVIVASGTLAPDLWLLVLGHKYAHLGDYVSVSLLVPVICLLSGATYTVILASGDTRFQYVAVGAGLISQAIMVIFVPIVDLASAYVFMIVTSVVTLAAQVVLLLRVLRAISRR